MLNPAERVEASALLSRLALDPLPTLLGLIEAYNATSGRNGTVSKLLLELASQWNEALGALRARGCTDAELLRIKRAGDAAIRLIAARYPEHDAAQGACAAFVRRSQGSAAFLQYVEELPCPPRKMRHEYFSALVDILSRTPSPEALRRAFSQTLPAAEPLSPEMLRFRFHRAVALRMLIWNCEFRSSFADAQLRDTLRSLPYPDPAGELDLVRRLLPDRTQSEQVDLILDLCACPALWRCPCLEAPRLALLEMAMSVAAQLHAQELLHRLLRALLEYAPQTVAFWSGSGWPQRVHALVMAAKTILPPGVHSVFVGLSAFALPDLDVVHEAYQRANAAGVTSSPQQTYLDPRSVASTAAPRSRTGETFRFLGVNAAERPQKPGLVVATSADEDYFRLHAAEWARTLHESGSTAAAHFHIIGRPEAVEAEIATVSALLPGRRITFSAEIPPVRRAFYYATARFLHGWRWLRHFQSTIIITDIDAPWTVRPETLDETVATADVGLRIFDRVRHYVQTNTNEAIFRYPRLKLWQCTSASCYLLRPSSGGQRFAELLASLASGHLSRFLDNAGSNWFIDQNILSALYVHVVRNEREIRVENLDALGLGLSGYSILDDERLLPSYGQHWISKQDSVF